MEEKIIQEILERIVRIETKIDGYNNIREDVSSHKEKIKVLEEKQNKIDDNITWLWRTIAGALILGFIAAFIKFN